MRRNVVLVVLLLAGALAAGEKGGPLRLRVTTSEGTTLEGHAQLKKDALEVETGSGVKKLPWARIAELEEVDPLAPPPEAERQGDRLTFESRATALEARKEEPRAHARSWTSLGEWARKRGLDAEAKKAFESAVATSPDDADAERALGRAKDEDGSWKDAREVFTGRKAAAGDLYELAQWAAKNGLDEEALATLAPLAAKNAFDKKLLPIARPLTDRHRQASAIGLPFKGRWRASEDPSHHHEAKTYAVYAVDFYKELDGKSHKGDGKELADHYAWGEPVLAVADGQVVGVQEGFADNPVGRIPAGDLQFSANGIAVLHSGGEKTFYLHIQKGSNKVKLHDHVKKGDVLGLVGNSGASSAPHLHFTLVDAHGLSVPWRCENFFLIADDGTRVRVKRGRVLEGELVEAE